MQNSQNWILLRGLARGVGHWGSFLERMKAKFPDGRFEPLDLPGNGSRCREESPLDIAEYVRIIRQSSQFVKAGTPFKILSISLGSMIAVQWMQEFPLEVKKSFLICTSSSGLSPFYERFQLGNFLSAPRLILSRRDAIEYEKTILHMVGNSFDRRQEELLRFSEYTHNHPVHPKNVLRQMWAAAQFEFPSSPPGEVHLLGSYGDRLVSPKCTLRIAEKWGMTPIMHPWAGHEIPLDDPEWILEQLS